MEGIALVKLALSIVTERVILIMSLIMSFVLAIWVMQVGNWQQVLALLIFVIFSTVVTKRDDNERAKQASQAE